MLTAKEKRIIHINEPMFVLDKADNRVAAIVDIDSYDILLDALEELNDLAKLAELRASGALGDTTPWEQAKAESDQITLRSLL